EAGGSYEDLTKGYDGWKSLYLEGEDRYQAGRAFYGRARFTERYQLDDTELLLGTAQRLTEQVDVQFEASASPNHEVLPEYSLLLGGLIRLAPGWDAGLTAKHATYTRTYSNLYSLGLGHEMGAHRLDYTLYVGKAEDASEVYAHRVQWTWYYGERSRVGLYAAVGQETENSGEPGTEQLLTDSVRTIGLIGRHWFGDGPWGIGYHLWSHEQSDRYTRSGASLGLRYRF
ncbi:MAG TPA: YaiO family outer membrane beta-barrel protein, partial [Desulfurivibrionaceae bacterium]|nr:YaiO family outer membrane beta-barrel protein [Desulfurivibrionaceae bacterium]